MSKESYTAWLRHRTECSDKALRTLGLTQKSEPIDKALLEKVRLNRAIPCRSWVRFDGVELH